MKNSPRLRLFSFLLLCLVASSETSARIGDSESQLERRLLRGSDKGLEITDDDLESFYRTRSPIFMDLKILAEEGLQYKLYYKSADDSNASSNRLWLEDKKGRRSDRPVPKPDGWLLHVAYLNGVSVLELYQRSEELTDVEIEGLLLMNAGDTRWVKGPPLPGEKVIIPQVFAANHHREDLAVYADIQEDSVLMFDPRLDSRIHEMELERAEEEGPESLEGF